MANDAQANPREQRKAELMEMWKTKRGQNTVLGLFHRIVDNDKSLRAGMSVFDVILDYEFRGGARPSEQPPRRV